jgi:hypothetical protein
LYDFIKMLMMVDVWYEAVFRWYDSIDNINSYKRSIKKWIDVSEKYNEKYSMLLKKILTIDEVQSYLVKK